MAATATTADPETTEDVPVHFVTIHGYDRAYRMVGSGPALLLIHGIGDSSRTWIPLMRGLAERFTVIAPDLLGHGDSDKPRADYSVAAYANGMRDLLTVLGVDRATVVGHSLGGGVAAQLAYQYPDLVERLILVATGGVDHDVNPALRIAAAPFAELVTPTLQWPLGKLVGGLVLDAMKVLGTDLGRDAEDLKAVFSALPDRDAREAFPGSELSIYPEAGHFPHRQDPERFLDELVAFIGRTKAAEHRPERWRNRLATGS